MTKSRGCRRRIISGSAYDLEFRLQNFAQSLADDSVIVAKQYARAAKGKPRNTARPVAKFRPLYAIKPTEAAYRVKAVGLWVPNFLASADL
jgi:hypothetical protein